MTDDRNPGLQALFDAARPTDANSAFVERVVAEIEKDRRRTVFGWATWSISSTSTSAVGTTRPSTSLTRRSPAA